MLTTGATLATHRPWVSFMIPVFYKATASMRWIEEGRGEDDNRIGGDTINSCHLCNKKIFQVVFISELFETQGNLILAR